MTWPANPSNQMGSITFNERLSAAPCLCSASFDLGFFDFGSFDLGGEVGTVGNASAMAPRSALGAARRSSSYATTAGAA